MQIKITKELIDYTYAHNYMEQKVADIAAGVARDEVWLLEHSPVYTAGTSAKAEDLLNSHNIPVVNVGRGGQYTYHEPEQRVGYIMLKLANYYPSIDLRKFVCDIEQVIIDTLAEFGIKSFRRSGRVGIWVDNNGMEEKIAAIGIRIRHGVSFHGFAVNINNSMKGFSGIVPCGLPQFGVTSVQKLGVNISLQDFDEVVIKKLRRFSDK